MGMKSSNQGPTWYLVADRSRLCLFEKAPENRAPELRHEFANPDGRKKGHDLVSDHPGRTFESQDRTQHGQAGGTRHSYGSATLPKDHAIADLVREATRLVADGRFLDAKSHLVVVAEPRLMGKLRPALRRVAPDRGISFHEKDFAWLNGGTLKKRLSSINRATAA
jgi:protein required for attachment to host cells